MPPPAAEADTLEEDPIGALRVLSVERSTLREAEICSLKQTPKYAGYSPVPRDQRVPGRRSGTPRASERGSESELDDAVTKSRSALDYDRKASGGGALQGTMPQPFNPLDVTPRESKQYFSWGKAGNPLADSSDESEAPSPLDARQYGEDLGGDLVGSPCTDPAAPAAAAVPQRPPAALAQTPPQPRA
eukprot:TRINITY_DN39174_c0_g1_i2.p1 TRINITY_DN39174_c0_g1~~TRINITY_DN39174_c0_g1_i2.p1  ORF type:complete len:206 (+),score=55.77 TRINITY_DN39174_c0_g1_i2:55-618(+)